MQSIARLALLALLPLTMPAAPVPAVTGGGRDAPAAIGADDYAAGIAAFKRRDWRGVIDHMASVIGKQPWEDEAYTLSGFAYSELGDYKRALASYDHALKLNPHNRRALAYLGEAYLDMGRPKDAEAMLERLNEECQRLADKAGGEQPDCQEREDLEEAIAVYRAGKS